MSPFKILTYNVHRGRSLVRRRDICAQVARILDFSSADAVCLQEVWRDEGFDRHRLHDHLCERTWPHRVFEATASFASGAQGNAIVSRSRVKHWSLFDISVPRREPRGILHAVLAGVGDREVEVFNVHFGLSRRERLTQVRLLAEFVEKFVAPDAPLFVVGDFNDWLREISKDLDAALGLSEVTLARFGRHGGTYPSLWPFLPLDRIYFRNAELVSSRIVREKECLKLSDHLPVEAEFRIA